MVTAKWIDSKKGLGWVREKCMYNIESRRVIFIGLRYCTCRGRRTPRLFSQRDQIIMYSRIIIFSLVP